MKYTYFTDALVFADLWCSVMHECHHLKSKTKHYQMTSSAPCFSPVDVNSHADIGLTFCNSKISSPVEGWFHYQCQPGHLCVVFVVCYCEVLYVQGWV